MLENPQRSAAFAVLTAPDIPSVLVELGCLSNPVEEHRLEQPAYRQLLARGLAQAIEAYFAFAARRMRAAALLMAAAGMSSIQCRAMSSRRQIHTRSFAWMYSIKRISALARPDGR